MASGVNVVEPDDARIVPSINSTSDKYGPSHDQLPSVFISKSDARLPVVGLLLGPGANNVVGHIAVLRQFELKKIPIHIISGAGFAAVLAAYYALGYSSEEIEWKIFNFFRKAKSTTPYSKEWYNLIDQHLLKGIDDSGKRPLKVILMTPLYDKDLREIKYVTRGSIRDRLYASLIVNEAATPSKFTASFSREVFPAKELIRMGADITVGIDVTGTNLSFEKEADFLIGLFGKVAGFVQMEKSELNLFFEIPSNNLPLDSYDHFSSLLELGSKLGDKATEGVLIEINNWKEKSGMQIE